MRNTLSILLLVQRELRQFYASDKDSQALSELNELIKSTEQDNSIETPWDFVEKYYPDYTGCSIIAQESDLCKLLDEEQEEGDCATDVLNDIYGGDINNPQIQIDHDRITAVIFERAIEGYINSLKK